MSRVLRRPMFRGGIADSEGTGITSGLMDNYGQGGRVGFKKGKGVFDFFSPEVVTDEERQTRSDIYPYEKRNVEELLNFTPIGRIGSGLNILRQAGRFPEFPAGYPSRGLTQAPFLSNQYFRETLRPYVSGATETLKQAGTGIKDFAKKYGIATGIGAGGVGTIYGALSGDEDSRQPITDRKFGLDKESGDFATGAGEQKSVVVDDVDIKDKSGPDKKPVYKETDRRAEIRKEMEFLKEELGDDIGAGELALIASRAIATPGTIADKIKAATELAIPIAQQKRKDKKAIALKAYETIRDREKAEIAAGKKGETGQLIDTYVAGKIKAGDKRSPEIIANEFIEERFLGAGKDEAALNKATYALYVPDIKNKQDKVANLKYKRDSLNEKLSKEEQRELDKAMSDLNRYATLYPDRKEFILKGFAKGGRINLAQGTSESMIEQNEQPEPVVEQTVVKEGPSDVSIKPVNKLSYPELRDRLPKEITDDIVRLISSSEEALQEFAYIRTQRDVNDFNVKYGVNLVLPSTR